MSLNVSKGIFFIIVIYVELKKNLIYDKYKYESKYFLCSLSNIEF